MVPITRPRPVTCPILMELDLCENISYCSHLSGWTPLMFAASRNHLVAVKHLILNGANVCTHSNKDGRTAFAIAASGGCCEIVSTIAHEAFKQKSAGFKFGSSLIFDSNDNSVQERLPWLKQDFDRAYHDLVSLFENEGLGLDSWDFRGWTPLMHAIYFGTSDVVKMLVRGHCNVNVADIVGKTPLMLAIECMREDIVFTLLNAGANPITETTTGLKAIDFAMVSECSRIINMVKAATEFRSELNNQSLRTVILVLAALGLLKYIPIFVERNIDVEKFNQLTEDDLRDLGLTNMGPRKKILSAVRDRMTETD